MDVNEILGYINNFVEHDGIKTIIIANEEEIATTNLSNNKELKYMIASSKNIMFLLNKDELEKGKSEQDLNKEIDLKQLKERVNLLFGEDDLYKQIKEKLIGVTICYVPNISKTIDQILETTVKDERIKWVILENKDFIINQVEFYKHQNIRTLLFCFHKFNLLAEILVNEIDLNDYKNLWNDIFKYLLVISIRYKIGAPLRQWQDNSEIEVISVSGDIYKSDYMKGFRFIDDFVLGASFDKVKVRDVVKKHIAIEKSQVKDPSDPLYKLLYTPWSCMEDSDAKELLLKVNLALSETPLKYDVSNYSLIISLNIILNRLGVISVDVFGIVEIMNNNLRLIINIDNNFNTFGWGNTFVEREDREQYELCIDKLYTYLKQYQEEKTRGDLVTIFDDCSSWTDELSKYVHENENKILNQKAFMSKLNIDKLVKAIKQSSSYQITMFRSIIVHTIYSFSNINEFYKSDVEYIEILKTQLIDYYIEMKEIQKIRASNINYLIKDLENILTKLS